MDSAFVIRVAGPDQVTQIRDLTLRAYAKWMPITPRVPRPMTADYDLAIQQHRFDCLYQGENMVGLIETVQQGDELLIVNVAIDPGHQGLGLGTQMMRHAEELAKTSELRATRLYTNKLMAENIALYERLGYRIEKEVLHDPGTVVVHMVRPISETDAAG